MKLVRLNRRLTTAKANEFDLRIRCPGCKHLGLFQQLFGFEEDGFGYHMPGWSSTTENQIRYGVRACPNSECWTLVFFSCDGDGENVETHPVAAVDFDSVDIPENVLHSFEEAIGCFTHGFYIAAGVMVRKTLEEICDDLGIKESNLKKRLDALKLKVTLPLDLLDSIDSLRLLGNDAAHLECKVFNQVGEIELGVSIDVMKELLKGLYQFKNLRNRIEILKKANSQNST